MAARWYQWLSNEPLERSKQVDSEHGLEPLANPGLGLMNMAAQTSTAELMNRKAYDIPRTPLTPVLIGKGNILDS